MLAAALLATPTLTFAFFGCNRVDAKDIDPAYNPSSANVPQLKQTLKEVAESKASILFAGGDLVNNYVDDNGSALRGQLEAWSKDVADFPKSIRLVPLPGNHELNKRIDGQRLPSLLTYPVWETWLKSGRYVYGSNGPTPKKSPADNLVLDESKMSYTLDRDSVRFIILNTDTRTNVKDSTTGTALGWIPADWATKQLDRAEKDPKVHAVFILGHRNLIDPSEGKGDAPIAPEAAQRLIAGMEGKHKLRAYICAHVHAWNLRKIPGTSVMQVISGDGGSKLEDWAKPEFGWLEVRVDKDGNASYFHHHRATPTPYNSREPVNASSVDLVGL